MNMNDPTEARRQAEYWLVQDAYDYALAVLGYTRHNAELTGPYGPGDAESIVQMARQKLLQAAERLGPALIVDARLMPLREVDRRLQTKQSPVVEDYKAGKRDE